MWLWLRSYLFQITTTHYSVNGRLFVIHQSFSYFCQFFVNLWLSQDVFQMSTVSLQANLFSSGKVVNHFYTLLFWDGSYFCCDGIFQFLNFSKLMLFCRLYKEINAFCDVHWLLWCTFCDVPVLCVCTIVSGFFWYTLSLRKPHRKKI